MLAMPCSNCNSMICMEWGIYVCGGSFLGMFSMYMCYA